MGLLPLIFQHNFKKLRNNLEHSRESSKKPLLLDGKKIVWEYLHEIYQYDQINAVPINRYLTNNHFKLTSYSKMRNHLADQVLDNEMLRIAEVSLIFREPVQSQCIWYSKIKIAQYLLVVN